MRKFIKWDGFDVHDMRKFAAQRTIEGRAFAVGTGVLQSSLPGQFLKFIISNPAGSGKNIYLFNLRGLSSKDTAEFMNVRFNPTGGVPNESTRRFAGSTIVGSGLLSVMDFRAEVSSTDFSGGSLSTSSLSIPAGAFFELEFFPVIFPPGRALAFSVDSGGVNHSLSLVCYFAEDEA